MQKEQEIMRKEALKLQEKVETSMPENEDQTGEWSMSELVDCTPHWKLLTQKR